MDFDELFANVCDALRREQRISYRALRRRFELSDDDLEDLTDELIHAKKWAIDEDNRVLVWAGDTDSAIESSSSPASPKSTSLTTTTPERAPTSYTPSYLAEKILTGKTSLEGERKVVTVLFADIKDSTELIRDLDPEEAQRLLDPSLHIMMNAVHRFEGTVNQVLGDGIMSIFGAPLSLEDHAARACYAALAMQSAMKDYTDEVRRSRGLTLRIRVGLNSGEVVVRTIGNDLHMDYSAVGQTTNLASRMEQLADPGHIILTASTLRLVEGLVQVNDLGPIPVKGMDEPVEVYELTGASSVRRRLQAAVARGLTKFVGRSVEIEALNQALEHAGNGQGQLVAAVGLAGVGKSRLMYEFVHSHRTQEWLVLESASVSYGKATPYFPIIDLLKRYVHVEDGDDARTIRAKVTGQILTLDESLQDTMPALLSLLDALPEDSPFLKLDPPQRRQRTLDGLERILLRESQVQPLVLVFEDLHWIDSETQALLDSLAERLPTTQLLLLVNYRPEYTHHWGNKTYYIQLQLDPLPPESSDAFLEALLGDHASLEPLKKLLIERTEGNPFFLEESVRTLVEMQVLAGEPGAYRLAQDAPAIQVPATVQAILAARIDRLPQDEKSLLQTASVIGTEVPFTLLQAIVEMPEDTLYCGLAHLQATEFLYETSLFPERVYTFKHALTHEVAYNSLLQERRRVLHTRIVETLETLVGDQVNDQVERLAHHALRGEVWDKAVHYYRQAGAKATMHSSHREAIACFEYALRSLQHLPEQRNTMEQAIDLRFDLRKVLVPHGEHERVLAYLREAETIAQRLEDQRRLGQVFTHMTLYFHRMGNYAQGFTSLRQALDIALTLNDDALRTVAQYHLGVAYTAQGHYRQALDVLRQNVTFLAGERLQESYGLPGLATVHNRDYLSWCLAELGEFPEGILYGKEGVQVAEAVTHPYSLAIANRGLGLLYLRKGSLHQAILALELALGLCKDGNFSAHFASLASLLGLAYTLSERVADAVPLLQQAVEHTASTRIIINQSLWIAHLGEAHLLADRLEDALILATRAVELSRTYEERGNHAWALRALGDIAMHRDPPEIDQAETHYQQALALANELGMKPLQAHCHRGLGKLYCQTGQLEQARTELSTAIDMYGDMEMNFWIPETETALAAVEGA